MAKFEIRVDTIWKVPLLVIGVRESTAFVEIEGEELHIKFGFSEERIPLADVGEPKTTEWSMFYGIGVRLGPDGIGYVGSNEGVVFVPLKKAHPFKVLFNIKHEFNGLYVSLVDPAAFIQAVTSRTA